MWIVSFLIWIMKMFTYHDTLEIEIRRHFPDILEDHSGEAVVGKGREYAKAV